MATVYTLESHYLISMNQSHLLKAMIFLWTYKTRHVSDDLGHMDKAGIVDSAFIVIACKNRLARVYSPIYTAFFRRFVFEKEISVHCQLPP